MQFSRAFQIGIFIFWLIISLITLSQSMLSAYVNQREMNWGANLIWSSGWLIWAFLSPVVFYLTHKYPIERQYFQKGILLHITLALLICFLQFTLEAAFSYLAYTYLTNTPPTKFWFLGLITYKLHVHLVIYFFILGIAHSLRFFQKYQVSALEASRLALKTSQLESQLTQAQLQSLKMQLQPHFLFNAHHAVIALMLKNENEAAIKMLTLLSDLLRITLQNSEEQFISLQKELDFIRLFLDIYQIRFQNQLNFQYQIEPDTLDLQVPNLILQPLVENALKHGLSPSPKIGKIEISAHREENKLRLEIKDNGPGMPKNEKIVEGIGLKNTGQRLKQLFGNEYLFELNENLNEAGLSVVLKIPLIESVVLN